MGRRNFYRIHLAPHVGTRSALFKALPGGRRLLCLPVHIRAHSVAQRAMCGIRKPLCWPHACLQFYASAGPRWTGLEEGPKMFLSDPKERLSDLRCLYHKALNG